MKVLISGDREWGDRKRIYNRIKRLNRYDDEIIVGDAKGADRLTVELCDVIGIDFKVFKADWEHAGKAAGIYRNNVMLDQKPDLVIAFHDDIENPKGTKHVIGEARKRGIKVEIVAKKKLQDTLPRF